MRDNVRVTSEETAAEPVAGADLPARRPRVVLFTVVAAVVLALDVISKLLVVAHLRQDGTSKRILGGVLYLLLGGSAPAISTDIEGTEA